MKRFLLITSIILLTATAQGQSRSSLPDAANPVVRLYPNPAISFITFDFQKNYEKGYSIQVFNFLGRKMFEGNNVNQATTVSLTDYTRGVYIYQIRDKSGKMVESGKFQVSK